MVENRELLDQKLREIKGNYALLRKGSTNKEAEANAKWKISDHVKEILNIINAQESIKDEIITELQGVLISFDPYEHSFKDLPELKVTLDNIVKTLETLVYPPCKEPDPSDSKISDEKDIMWDTAFQAFEEGEYDIAIAGYKKYIAKFPDKYAWNNLCLAYRQIGDYQKAIEAAMECLKLDPNYSPGVENLGWSQADIGDYDNAIGVLQKAVKFNPQSSTNWDYLGFVLWRKGLTDEAIDALNKAKEINPNHVSTWVKLSFAYSELKLYDKAIESSEKAVELDGNNAYALNSLGWAHAKKGNYDDTLSAAGHAVDIMPEFAEAWHTLGYAYQGMQEYDRAVDCYKKALKINPELLDPWFDISLSYFYLFEFDKAQGAITRLLELNPGYQGAIILRDKIEVGLKESKKIEAKGYHTERVTCLAVTSDSKFVVSGSDDASVKVWNIETKNLERTIKGHRYPVQSVGISPDNKYVISSSEDATTKVWELATGRHVRTLEGHENTVFSVAIGAEGNLIATGEKGKIFIWDFWSGNFMRELSGHEGWVSGLVFTSDSRYLISSSFDRTVKIWDLNSWSCFKTFEVSEKALTSVAISPDDKYIATSSWDKTVKLIKRATGEIKRTFIGHKAEVISAEFSPLGTFLVSGAMDKMFILWDVKTGEMIKTFDVHKESVNAVVFTPDADYIISGAGAYENSKDNRIKFHKFLEGRDEQEKLAKKFKKQTKQDVRDDDDLDKIINKTKEYIKKLPSLYEDVTFAKIMQRTGIKFQQLESLIEDLIFDEKLDARIEGKAIIFNKGGKGDTIKTGFSPSDLKILRGGDWKIEGGQSIFYFKVKVENNSGLVISSIQIILTSVPKGLEAERDRYKIGVLRPNSYESPTFKLKAKESCVGDVVEGTVIYLDPSGKQQTSIIEPFDICYVCNLLTPKPVTRDEFNEKIEFMEDRKIVIDSDLSVGELEARIAEIVKNCNFAMLQQLEDSKREDFLKLEAFAEGLYDKQDVALSIAVKEVKYDVKKATKKGTKKGAKIVVKAMSEREDKLTDILKDLSVQLDDIKSDTELIKEYTAQIEEIFDRVDDLEKYLIGHLGSDFEKIRHAWSDFKAGTLNKKGLIKEAFKIFGVKLIKKFVRVG